MINGHAYVDRHESINNGTVNQVSESVSSGPAHPELHTAIVFLMPADEFRSAQVRCRLHAR